MGLHVIIFGMLFVSFAMTPELPPAKPIVQATLYQLQSQSQAQTQTNQKIAGEAEKTAAREYEAEQLEQRRIEQERQAARAAEQKKAEEARKAAAAKKADEARKAEEVRKAEEARKVAEQKKQAEIARKKAAEEEARKKAAQEAAKKKAAEEAKKKAAEEARKKAAEEARKKAAAEAARKAAEDKKAQALAELLAEDTQRQQAMADTQGSQVAADLDDLIRMRAAQGWTRPPSARNNMSVSLRVNMLPDGTITGVSVARSSGDVPFDNSAVAAVRNIGRLAEMQGLTPQQFQPYRSFTMTFTPEDLAL